MKTAEEWLLDIFNPSPNDDSPTCRDDLQLAITLNPSLEMFEQAINQARSEAIKECAEQRGIYIGMMGDPTNPVYIEKTEILKLLDQIK